MNPSPTPTSRDASNATYRFSATELTRLAVYRAAIRAGFYSDLAVEIEPTTAPTLVPSGSSVTDGDQWALRAAGFTPTEITRLVAYRDAVAAGLFRDSAEHTAAA